MLTSRHGVRLLGQADLSDFLVLTGRDPVVNVFAEHRARITNLEPRWLGGEMWGRFRDEELVAACHVGANLVPVQCTDEDALAFAAKALGHRRSVATIVGLEHPVDVFWHEVAHRWSEPREIRPGQPHMQIDHDPLVAPDPLVRRCTSADLDALFPACVAMYTEEVGISPEAGGGRELYRARVAQLVARGWSFARIEDGRVVFKAEVACATDRAAQIQGVYVDPARRGEGLANAGMAAVVRLVREQIAPIASLYVNEWNVPARRAYERVGFRQTATFATIMF
jgi:ribosomal protein S18 acetylase RimI-like enzyme